ncbi:mercuric transporter MerT family protein [Methylothermus subterraneus]
MLKWNEKSALIAGVAAAVGASACCVLPLVLVSLGIGGAWVGSLTAMAPYRPIFLGLTLLFLGLAFYQLYLKPRACAPGEVCADLRVLRR